MGSTSFIKPKSASYRTKSGSSVGSDKEMNVKLKRSKIRRPAKMNEFGIKRIPDYTEMAHKEAVSKLKYFLSGNAPSLRSYGGSASIKNLDESDGDLDKKYSSSYNALSEYKPRPRLTAKYTTLYADSLNNYTPPQPVTSNAPQGDLSGGTNPDVVNFIQKQEEYIEQLERESQYCRDELNNLLGKVKEVISENEHLHEAQKNKIISRMFHSYAGSETDDLDDVDSTGLDSDNKVSPSKPRKTRSRSIRLEGPNIVFESRIAELEAQLTQSKIDLKKVQDENNENKRKLANGLVDSTCLDGFKRQIDNLQRDKSTLESQISKLKLSLEQKEGDFDSRSKKGSDIVEQQLREERNNLEIEIRRLKDELSSERNKTRSLAGEGARRAVAERSAAEQRYTTHCDQLQRDLAAQYDYAAKLQLDLERQRREENDLKRDISMKSSAIEELKMELKNKTASLQADLAQAHAEKAALEEELASARLAIERQQRQAKHETNRLNSEIQSLRQRLDRADADLVHSRRENLRLSEQISNLERELNMKNLTPMTPEKKGKDKELSTMLESMENKHAKTVAELESMIQSQNSLMEKLTGECRLLTDKLDDANRRHKMEKSQLLCRNSELMRKLRNLWSSHKKYCTTTIAPYRSYTPLSGYPSSSCYELDRTYMTSTPYTYRNRHKRCEGSFYNGTARDDIGVLSRNLSNLSIDRLCESDDDPIQELATLQRQVDHLGRSLQSPHPPSKYQAPSTHAAATTRISNTPTDKRPDYPRTESTGDTSLGHHDRIGGNSDTYQTRDINDDIKEQVADNSYHQEHPAAEPEQATESKTNILKQPSENVSDPEQIQMESSENIVPDAIITEQVEEVQEKTIKNNSEYENLRPKSNHEANEEELPDKVEHVEKMEISEEKQPEPYQNRNYPEGEYPNYEQNYEQQEYSEQPEYTEQQEYSEQPAEYSDQPAEYSDQPAEYSEQPAEYSEQPAYTEQQGYTEQQEYAEQPQYTEQYQNYEQYPQQYTDPNTQYQGQEGYENYGTDGNYSEQNYENQQLNQEYTTQYQEAVTEQTESKDSKTPNENVVSQS